MPETINRAIDGTCRTSHDFFKNNANPDCKLCKGLGIVGWQIQLDKYYSACPKCFPDNKQMKEVQRIQALSDDSAPSTGYNPYL